MAVLHKHKTISREKYTKTEFNITQLLPLNRMINEGPLFYDETKNAANTYVRDELRCGEYEICFDESDFPEGEYNFKQIYGEEPESNKSGRIF